MERPVGRPGSVGGGKWSFILDLDVVREKIGKSRFTDSAFADEKDFGVRVLVLLWRRFDCSRVGERCSEIPYSGHAILRPGEGMEVIWTPRHAPDAVGVAFHHADTPAGLHLPQADGL